MQLRMDNPPEDLRRRFKLYLTANNLLKNYTERDISEAAVAVGVDPDDVPDMVASLGSTL